jgi:hypothetical protein
MNHPFHDDVLDALFMMRSAGMVDYGRFPSNKRDVDLMVKAYCIAIDAWPKVTVEHIQKATVRLIRTETDFPSAHQFASMCDRCYTDANLLVGVPLPNGLTALVNVPRTATKEEREAAVELECKRLGYPAPLPDLDANRPVTSEDRQRAWGRLDAAARKLGINASFLIENDDAKDEAA